ncbi:MAG: FadD7 family fatty acid--CoA ligase [Mycolicibacterium sp.]|uniref:FadD7 family fatty acid--CoA ligase n=1 Tax=Mycolicibacterium sp. TaxID=2320850 RepID=UPI003D0BF84C
MNAVDASNSSRDAGGPSWRLGRVFDGAAAAAPNATALIAGRERHEISYTALRDLVVALAERLLGAGLNRGDVVAVESTNTVEYVVGLLAASRAGLVVAPLDPALSAADKRMRTEMAGVRAVLLAGNQPDDDAASRDLPTWTLGFAVADGSASGLSMDLDMGAPPRSGGQTPALADNDALIMFTSGTTGKPKMVPWTHDNVAASVAGIIDTYRLGPDDSTVAVMPLFHGHGLMAALLATLASGGRILLPQRGRFSAQTFWDDMEAADATWYTAVPTIHQILLDRSATDHPSDDYGRLRFVRSCSAPLSPSVVQRLEATFGAPMLAAYGMTETTHQCASVLLTDDDDARVRTAGSPTGVAVRIVDEHGASCSPGVAGEIQFRGPTVVRGYLENPEATAATFVEGWVRTGDLGVLDGRGAVTVIGRIKEQINRGGEKISPERVERVLLGHPEVTGAVVFGVPDELYGERVAAAVVCRGRSRPDLVASSREELAGFEIPEHILFVEELPVTAKGSVDRAKAVKQFAEHIQSG